VDLLGEALQLLQPGDLFVDHVISLLQQTERSMYLSTSVADPDP
jgi:hypothetical protein